MKKPIFSFLFIFLVSCGPEPEIEPKSQMERLIGAMRTLDRTETLSPQETRIIQSMCVNLRNKENVFRDFDTFDTKLVYTGSRLSCGEDEPVKQGPFTVEVSSTGGGFSFQAPGIKLPFSEVVTTSDPVMNKVCQHVASALDQEAQPAKAISTGGAPLWLTGLQEGDPRCVRGNNAGCLYIERGVNVRENIYRVEDVKFFAVNGNAGDQLRGVLMDRRQMITCGGEEASFSEVRMSFVKLDN